MTVTGRNQVTCNTNPTMQPCRVLNLLLSYRQDATASRGFCQNKSSTRGSAGLNPISSFWCPCDGHRRGSGGFMAGLCLQTHPVPRQVTTTFWREISVEAEVVDGGCRSSHGQHLLKWNGCFNLCLVVLCCLMLSDAANVDLLLLCCDMYCCTGRAPWSVHQQ